MSPTRVIAIAVALVALAACGDGETSGSPTDAPFTTAADVAVPPTVPATGAVAGDGDLPVPTIAPDVPEPFLGAIGPIAVVGESLPPLGEGDDPAIGQPAPVLVGENFAGERVVVDPAVDGPTWLVFLAHWCPHCNDEIPVINELRDEGRIPDGVRVVGVSTAVDPGRPNFPPGEWLDDKEWTFDELADGIDMVAEQFIASSAYGISGFPFSVLVDGDGVVRQRWSGGREPDELVSLVTNHLTVG